jgi:glycerol uptake facilitator-like aquaporin
METHHMGHLTGAQILRNSLMKLLFEGMGTMFLTMTFNISQKQGFGGNQVALLLVLWVLTIFGLKISGAHYNPAVSLAFMLRKDVGKFPRILGFAYIGVQIAGAFLGALISWFLLVNDAIWPVWPTSGMIYPNTLQD